MCSCADVPAPTRSSSADSAAPGTAVTLADTARRWAAAVVKVRSGRFGGCARQAEHHDDLAVKLKPGRPGLVLPGLQEAGHAHAGNGDVADARARPTDTAATGGGDGDPQPARGTRRDADRLGRSGDLRAGGGLAGGGGDDQAGGHRPRNVIKQAHRQRPGKLERVVKVDLDPLPVGAVGARLGPGGGRVAVERVHRVALRYLPQPGPRRGGGDAGRAGQHGDGLMTGGAGRQELAGRLAGGALRVIGRNGAGRGVGIRRVVVGQAETVSARRSPSVTSCWVAGGSAPVSWPAITAAWPPRHALGLQLQQRGGTAVDERGRGGGQDGRRAGPLGRIDGLEDLDRRVLRLDRLHLQGGPLANQPGGHRLAERGDPGEPRRGQRGVDHRRRGVAELGGIGVVADQDVTDAQPGQIGGQAR